MTYEKLKDIVCYAVGRSLPVPPPGWPEGCGERTVRELGLTSGEISSVILFIDEKLAENGCAALLGPGIFPEDATIAQVTEAILDRVSCKGS